MRIKMNTELLHLQHEDYNKRLSAGLVFCEGYAPVCKDKLWGFTNEQGEEVIPCKYVDDYLNHLPHMYFNYKRIKNTKLREKALSLLVKD